MVQNKQSRGKSTREKLTCILFTDCICSMYYVKQSANINICSTQENKNTIEQYNTDNYCI